MKPTIMISSTYSDLKDIRHVLHDFITNDLGYNCLISEHHDFPVNSLNSAIEICRTAVKKETDILVLIIDKRFGSIDTESGRSVTNIEYFEARHKRIPIMAFISKHVLAFYEVWKSNPFATFEGLVDSDTLFSFIDTVYAKDKIWTYRFDNLNEIVSPIRAQLANMLAELLINDRTIRQTRVSNLTSTISTNALNIILSKEIGWEYFFLFQRWRDEIDRYSDIYYEHQNSIYIGLGTFIPDDHINNWIHSKMNEILQFTRSADHIINRAIANALAEPGVPADLEEIVRITEKIGKLYSFLLDWSRSVTSTSISEPYDELLPYIANLPNLIIDEFRNFPNTCESMIREALLNLDTAKTTELNIQMKFDLYHYDELQLKLAEFNR